ncbi:MAG: DUF952 domain-containing protein [Blastocatellia bacterium]|jgi:uncharacterized protein (DUF952 family)|nr:DUF952 domain-containing protein [Blastocatellia bacterium]
MIVYHIVLPDDWAAFDTDLYRAKSLETEGFIHCSFAEQLDGVIERYYARVDEIVILEIETDALMSRLVKEPSTNDEIYPHIYGPINRAAIVSETKRKVTAD